MKKIQMRAASLAARLCGIGLAVIGLSSCDKENEHPDMYGIPPTNFNVDISGDVTEDEGGAAVEGADVVLKSDGVAVSLSRTDADGRYSLKSNQGYMITDNAYVACYPDEDSGLEADSVELAPIDKDLNLEINFRLKKK